MTDMPLHPSLYKLSITPRRILRLVGFLTFITAAGVVLYMITMAMTSGSIASIMIMGLVVLVMFPLIILMGVLLRYLDRWLGQQLARANRLLTEQSPASVRLTPTHIKNRQGTLMALHWPDHTTTLTKPLFALINPSFRWSTPPAQEITIDLYYSELKSGDDIVALQPDGNVLLGKLIQWEDYERQMQKKIILVAFILLIAISICGYMALQKYRSYQYFKQELYLAKQSAHWPKAPGVIQHAELITTKISRGKSRVTAYEAQIGFEYTVADKMQQGNILFFCNRPTTDRQAVEHWLANYPVGQSVTVYYDPEYPVRSVLSIDQTACESAVSNAYNYWLIVCGAIGFFLLVILLIIREMQKQCSERPLR